MISDTSAPGSYLSPSMGGRPLGGQKRGGEQGRHLVSSGGFERGTGAKVGVCQLLTRQRLLVLSEGLTLFRHHLIGVSNFWLGLLG